MPWTWVSVSDTLELPELIGMLNRRMKDVEGRSSADLARTVLTDTARTITVTHTFTARQSLTGGATLGSTLLFSADNTHDIGASGATRPRDFYLGRNAVVGGTLGVTGLITATAGQIAFPAVQNASSNANTLDDYEEGTWTPTISSQTNCSSTSVTRAVYTKIGRLVYVQLSGTTTVAVTATSTSFVFTLPVNQGDNLELSVGMGVLNGVPGRTGDNTGGNATEAIFVVTSSGTGSQGFQASLTYHAAT